MKVTKKKPTQKRAKSAAPPSDGARERLIAVGLTMFAERGLEGVSVRDLASAAKVNLSLVSYYFGGKEGLYKTIIEEHALDARNRMYEAVAPYGEAPITKESFCATLQTIIGTLVRLREQSPEMSILMQRERLDGLPHARQVYEEIMGPLGESLVALIEAARKAGVVRGDLNSRSFFLSLIESVFGYFILHDCKLKVWKDAYRFPKQTDDYIQFMGRLFTEGIVK